MRESTLRWTVALEAALFFSMPSWWLMGEAWPANGPIEFALTVVAGATVATVLFHIIPALCASALAVIARHPFGKALVWGAGAWLCVGAATSLAKLARIGASNCIIQYPEVWDGAAIVFGLIAITTAWLPIRRQRPVIALCFLLGGVLAAASLCLQFRGLYTRNPSMGTEPVFLGVAELLDGMLMASAPSAILAYRIGRLAASRKTILWTAAFGLWLPLCASATLICVAMMFGARLYWKPSLPITADWAFGWLFAGSPLTKGADAPGRLWMLGLANLGPAVVCAIWVNDLTGFLSSRGWRVLAWSCLAAAAWFLSARPASGFYYYSAWIDSVIIASLAMPVVSLLVKLRR